jgi:hypothetical protein
MPPQILFGARQPLCGGTEDYKEFSKFRYALSIEYAILFWISGLRYRRIVSVNEPYFVVQSINLPSALLEILEIAVAPHH